MDSLEKSMLFIPNRLFVFEKEMYVSFNIAVIPTDMDVTSMTLFVPLPAGSTEISLQLHEITTAWDEQYIRNVCPAYILNKNEGRLSSETNEGRFDLNNYIQAWRFDSLENHGVFLQLHSLGHLSFSEETPPYLLVITV
ncbi:hypothetical protein [Paenibacillus sp. N3.4]|uniref:hypothetical protein n=1 Tax=Paenibacillus sp. N3.4 TaxID=2603222 RepID=UPI0011CAE8E0|nr:hypothetical protein [Paenibacillus sp. N3.4]TXK84646.1 hypothetical protein FU659_07380 [Paenibacillus sp. N3.4]